MAAKGVDKRLFDEAKRYIPGGVNSPVRSFKAVGGYPVFIKRGEGSRIYGEDGRKFIDYCLSWGALILGHAHLKVVQSLEKAIKNGTSFGAATKLETELARLIVETVPSIEQVRLTNSGTEAVMGAIRVARAYTARSKIIKFEGSYHGHADYLLASNSPGVPEDFTRHTIVLSYNDIEGVEKAARRYPKELAAIIVEPVAANCGVILPKPGFLEGLRRIADKYGAVLIFDEVITGFRLSLGGAEVFFGVKPDLTCLGKIVGGGLPVGAFGGRKEMMRLLAPSGDVYQAGTLSGNPVAVTAGISTLNILREEDPYRSLEKKTKELCEGIESAGQKYGVQLKVNQIASLFSIFFTDKEVTFKRFFHNLLKEGVYLSPSGFEANFLSVAHTKEDLKNTLGSIGRAIETLKKEE